MNSDFNPYKQWLGISETDLPPNHYRLLGLRDFEDDTLKIEKRARTLFDKIQDIAAGSTQIAATQKLLNEISTARVTLLDDEKRAQYEDQLRAKLGQIDLNANAEFGSAHGLQNFDGMISEPLDEDYVPPILKPAAKAKRRALPVKRKKRSPLVPVLAMSFIVLLAAGIGGGVIYSRLPAGGFFSNIDTDVGSTGTGEIKATTNSEPIEPEELSAFEMAVKLEAEQRKHFDDSKKTAASKTSASKNVKKTPADDIDNEVFHEDFAKMKPGDLATHPFVSPIGTWSAKGKVFKGPWDETVVPKRINIRPGQIGEVSLKLAPEVNGLRVMRLKIQRSTPDGKKFELKVFAISDGEKNELSGKGNVLVGKHSTIRFQLPPQTTEIKIVCDTAKSTDPEKPWQGSMSIREVWFESR